jgi:hypothetical protein
MRASAMWILGLSVLAASCGGEAGSDAGRSDAGAADAGRGADAGALDAGERDAGAADADLPSPDGGSGTADAGPDEWPTLPACINAFDQEEEHELHRGAGAGGVSYRLWRCRVGQAPGRSGVYRADAFELTFGGRTLRVDAAADLTYESTHHNWADTLEARHPEARLRWWVEFDLSPEGGLSTFVSATDPTGAAVLLPETQVR